MKEYFTKHETLISIVLIIIYIILNSFCMQNFGQMDLRSVAINTALSLAIICFVIKNKLLGYFGLNKFSSGKVFLYFLPLSLMVLLNFLGGISVKNSSTEIVAYILFMINVGFLEEIIFRGFLFKMMEKDNVNRAIAVTSLTFGIGHILNLLNGADIIPTLIQIVYSTAVGFLFVTIFLKSKSLWPCIITHILVNSTSIFAKQDNIMSMYIAPIILVIVSVWYTIYLMNIKDTNK